MCPKRPISYFIFISLEHNFIELSRKEEEKKRRRQRRKENAAKMNPSMRRLNRVHFYSSIDNSLFERSNNENADSPFIQ